MKRSKPMKRTAFARKPRSTESAPDRAPARAPLKRRSAKQRAVYAGSDGVEGRADFVARILAERPHCEACPRISTRLFFWRWCSSPTEVHEILRRSAGGDILAEANVIATCHQAHGWIHTHPKEARELGLLKSRYAGRNEPQG